MPQPCNWFDVNYIKALIMVWALVILLKKNHIKPYLRVLIFSIIGLFCSYFCKGHDFGVDIFNVQQSTWFVAQKLHFCP